MVRFIKPIREKAAALQNDPAQIDEIMAMGAAESKKKCSSHAFGSA